MFGFEFNWLMLQLRSAGTRLRFAKRSLLTLLVAGVCAAYAFLPVAPRVLEVACLAAPAKAKIEESATDWPRTLMRLWLILPHLTN